MAIESLQNQILYALQNEFLTKMKTPAYHYDVQAVELGSQLTDLDGTATFPILGIYPIHGEPDSDAQNNVHHEKVDIIIEGYLAAVNPIEPPVIAINKLLDDIRNVILTAPKTLGGAYDIRYKKEFKSEWELILPGRLNPDVITIMFTFCIAYNYFPRK